MSEAVSKQKILIVDDAPIGVQLMAAILRDEYEIIVATNGLQALTIAEEERPDLILLDVNMPLMDGYETCRRLKADPLTRHIPVIFVTAFDHEEEEAKGLELGAIDYLSKPFSTAIVRVRVKNHLRLKRQQDLLKRLSLRDGLTGVANRRSFDDRLDIEWRRAVRPGYPISLILLDIDFFKPYNDHYGHVEGDACLRRVAAVLDDTLKRIQDFFARYGGEEFVAILPRMDHPETLLMAEKMRAIVHSLAIPHEKSGASEYVTISLGCATGVPNRDGLPSELLESADKMLYKAKKAGRNRVMGMG